eukprot:TRINITY_DN15142_c0_g1_i1.p1 TRINITY_DN15142_c0_g1~~TRINITY_DN15142_c0_g1_i1.p1  ORF type:complete len:778 (+),score=183.57 TRINITY_DN15142_c0_g1_i1:609-2942(+)
MTPTETLTRDVDSKMLENQSADRDFGNHLDYLMRSPEPADIPGSGAKLGTVVNKLNDLQLSEQIGPSSPGFHLEGAVRAVEIAESAIMQQMEENQLLKSKLQMTSLELESYKHGAALRQNPDKLAKVHQHSGSPYLQDINVSQDTGSPTSRRENTDYMLGDDTQRKLVIHQHDCNNHSSSPTLSAPQGGTGDGISNAMMNEMEHGVSSGHNVADFANYSRISSPSSQSASPNRFQRAGDYESRLPLTSQVLTQASDSCNQQALWREDLLLKIRSQEEEISRLRKRLSENAIKELKILNEKHVLEKRIAAMRMAFDQQQQDLVDAASKAISYRQSIMEENIRLTYALQDAEQERSIFVSSLLPLLSEYDLPPSVNDAHSIVSNVKVLVQHLHEKLNLSEGKLKDSQFQLTTWRLDPVCQSPYAPQSPIHSNGDNTQKLNPNCLDIVPQPIYSQGQLPLSPQFRGHRNGVNWESAVVKYRPDNTGALEAKVSLPATNGAHPFFPNEEESMLQTNDLSSDNEVEDTRDPGGRSPRLPPVQEEPNSSLSGGEEEHLPAIENLQIIGNAMPGNTLQACGFSVHGTSVCVFQWVRHLEDGSIQYIDGAAQPDYTVTADDVDALLAIECLPMDEKGRKGDLVKVFVNEDNKVTSGKITCEVEMRQRIEGYFFSRQATFDVQLSAGSLDIWEAAVLTIKKSSYDIKTNKRRVVHDKYSSGLQIAIPYGNTAECVISSSDGKEHVIATPDDNQLRDTIVLTFRLFMKQALERRKGKRKGFFSKQNS